MREWTYDSAPDLERTLVERLRGFPREPDMLTYALRGLAGATTRLWLRTYHRLRVVGRENLPASGSFVIVANHASHLDTLVLTGLLPLSRLHRVFPAAASDYFFTTVPRLAIAAMVNALPFDRRLRHRRSLNLCAALLENPGNVLIVFPEGTRTTTGRMGDFKPGLGMLLAGRSVPAVPCHIAGAFEAWPKGRLAPRPWPLRLTIGAPLEFSGLPRGKESARRICRTLHDAILALDSGAAGKLASEQAGE